MQGKKTFEPKMFYELSLNALVPQDDFYRKIGREVDFSFLYRKTGSYYGDCGQESIDPTVFFKILLVGYLNNLNRRSFAKIIFYRREMMILRRNIYPFRDIITVLMRNEDGFFNKRTLRYLKDVSDHINQAREMVENYRESISNIQDLYLNQENNKLSRSMKVTAIVTCLLAPATVIGGIFGMNFKYIPFLNNPYAFYIAIAFMLLIPVYMIYVFKKNGWF